ncbi:unnamed protein product [Diabrotica balteata]|uniref:Uncharacterized protein n=1 Tax=Diabrotica balteata TaxID=107213 RepID=A0A9N9SNR7_DIABA|nr:unnamed protein product [Diabrotica balteata]
MISYRISILLLFSVAYLIETTSADATCCDNNKQVCIDPHCKPNQIAKRVPELCRCCPQCYTIKGLRQSCGDQIFAVCKKPLICISNRCTYPL